MRSTSPFTLRALAPGLSLKARCTLLLRAAMPPHLTPPDPAALLDITLATAQGYIIADASGIPAYNPQNPGQRDTNALRAQDPAGRFGDQ